jgi:hypothetical protein
MGRLLDLAGCGATVTYWPPLPNLDGRPVEVWLTQRNMLVNGRVVFEDESTAEVVLDSLNLRGAQRETTSWLKSLGYRGVGRWETTAEDPGSIPREMMRRFRKLVDHDKEREERIRALVDAAPPLSEDTKNRLYFLLAPAREVITERLKQRKKEGK